MLKDNTFGYVVNGWQKSVWDLHPTRCALVTVVTLQLSLARQQTQRDSFLPPGKNLKL